jgi:hypothetical protein
MRKIKVLENGANDKLAIGKAKGREARREAF